jgi:hypothetical protein
LLPYPAQGASAGFVTSTAFPILDWAVKLPTFSRGRFHQDSETENLRFRNKKLETFAAQSILALVQLLTIPFVGH